MGAEHWPRVKEIFGAAIEMDLSRRESYVRQESGEDRELFAEVMSLLERDSSSLVFGSTMTQPDGPEMLLNERYRLGEEIGRGGFGIVYAAQDEKLDGRRVVIKTPHIQSPTGAWLAEKFEKEIQALARIDHPGVVGALDRGTMPDGRPFFVMQFVGGRPLSEAIAAGPMPLQRVADISAQIGRALSAAHHGGVWHRDLKPGNVMLQPMTDGSELVRLIDFGIATVKQAGSPSNQEQTQNIVGSLAYMAPEQFQGIVSRATDLYAFGIIVFEMLAGRKPFDSSTHREILVQQKAGASGKLRGMRTDLPERTRQLLLKALSFDPENRPKEAAEFGAEVARSLTAPDGGYGVSRRNALVGAVGTTIAAAVGTIAWWHFHAAAPIPTVMYSVLAQRSGGALDFLPPGQAFEKSDSFILLVRTSRPLHLYLVSEEQGSDSMSILFPIDQGSSELKGSEQRRIPPASSFGFDSASTSLTLWMVWSEHEFKLFEELGKWSNSRHKGVIGDNAERGAVRQALAELPQLKATSIASGAEQSVQISAPRFALKLGIAIKPG